MKIVFKNKTSKVTTFISKIEFTKVLNLALFINFDVDSGMNPIMVIKLNGRIVKHIGISPLTKKQVKPKNSSVASHFLFYKHSATPEILDYLSLERVITKRFY